MVEQVKKKNNIIKFPIKEDWENELMFNSVGNISNTIENYCIILENHSKFKDKLKFNELSNTEEFDGKPLEQVNYDNIQRIIEKNYGIYSEKKVASAIRSVAYNKKYHPVKQYLEKLKWDGIKRVDTAFADYFGAANIPYNAMCLRLMIFGAIERVYNPRL